MSVTLAIYVQGCARSGNTLMRELCVSAFCGTELVRITKHRAECSLSHLVDLLRQPTASSLVHVASRNRENMLFMSLELLRANPGVKVLWMLRDPRDVLTSIHADQPGKFYVLPERLIRSLQLYGQFKNEVQVLTIRYEELVTNPEAIQARVAQTFNLTERRSFAAAYKFFPRFYENVRAMHSIRPIDTNSLHKWRNNPAYQEYLQQVFTDYPGLIPLARECGYEITLGTA